MYDVDRRLDELAHLLRESGFRLTPQRLAVVRAFIEHEDHPSAETVYQRIGERLPTTRLATVYNAVEVLREIGQVLELRPVQGPSRFDVRQPHRHPHLFCTRCGRVEDAPLGEEHLPAVPREAAGWQGLDVRLDFHGVCPTCKEAERHG